MKEIVLAFLLFVFLSGFVYNSLSNMTRYSDEKDIEPLLKKTDIFSDDKNFVVQSLPLELNSSSTQYFSFDGEKDYIEIEDHEDFSLTKTGELTLSVWVRPDTLQFKKEENSGYVNWLGKGSYGEHEWTFRLYSKQNSERRPNRISFYNFNALGGKGSGSYVQESINTGEWIHILVTNDLAENKMRIYKNGVLKDEDPIYGEFKVIPQNGEAALRIGTRDFKSYFKGSIAQFSVYDRVLQDDEIKQLYEASKNADYLESGFDKGLVAWYPLNDGTAKDYSGKGHHGVLYFFNS